MYKEPSEAEFQPIANYTYNPMGTISKISFGNDIQQRFLYDLRDRVTNYNIYKTDMDNPLLWQSFFYDAVGNRIQDNTYEKEESIADYCAKHSVNSLSKLGVINNYSYDNLYRLTGVHYAGIKPYKDKDQSYRYDPVGNRMEHDFEMGHHAFEYNNLNQLTKLIINKGKGEKRYKYDLNGNLTNEFEYQGNNPLVEKRFFWDFDDRLTGIDIVHHQKLSTNQSNASLDFCYDTEGNRIRKEVYYGDTLSKQRTYVGGKEEYAVSNKLENVYLGDVRIKSNGDVEYYHKDVLGSTVLITDTNGEKIERNVYDPFGSLEKQRTKTDNDKLFTGKETDFETGLQYFGARYYDPVVGRWIGRDPIKGSIYKPMMLNYYIYGFNNPLRYVDIAGLFNKETGEIEKDDTLSDIAKELETTVDELLEANPQIEDKDKIYEGNFLNLPQKDQAENGNANNTKPERKRRWFPALFGGRKAFNDEKNLPKTIAEAKRTGTITPDFMNMMHTPGSTKEIGRAHV